MIYIRMIYFIFNDNIPISGKKNKFFAEFIKVLLARIFTLIQKEDMVLKKLKAEF